MGIYESIVILDSLMAPKDIDTALERFSSIITDNDGKIRKVDKWGKKRLAYEIQKKQYGFYAAIEFEAVGDIPKELQNEYNYNDKVLRFLTYRYDKFKLKAIEKEGQEKSEGKPEVTPKPTPEVAPTPAAEVVEAPAPAPEVEPAEPVEETAPEKPEQEEKKE